MIRPILIWPDPALTLQSAPVTAEELDTDEFRQLVADLWDTLYDAGGVGISAVQIGVLKRVFVVDASFDKRWVFVNPEILHLDGARAPMNEGCLSLPGILEQVERYPAVSVRALDEAGRTADRLLTGLAAQCFQHEIEHLDGKLIPDHLEAAGFARVRAQMFKFKKQRSLK